LRRKPQLQQLLHRIPRNRSRLFHSSRSDKFRRLFLPSHHSPSPLSRLRQQLTPHCHCRLKRRVKLLLPCLSLLKEQFLRLLKFLHLFKFLQPPSFRLQRLLSRYRNSLSISNFTLNRQGNSTLWCHSR
jgi:hypothetical protein